MKIEFKKGEWEQFFTHAYCCRFPQRPLFFQGRNYISNRENPNMADGFDYTTIITHEKYGKGTKIKLECSFEKYGAPLITLTDEVLNGVYKNYHEVVLWENGINVWHLSEIDGKMQIKKLASIPFKVDSSIHSLCVEILENGIKAKAMEHEIYLRIENLPSEVFVGLTACENINRFYSVTIENEGAK